MERNLKKFKRQGQDTPLYKVAEQALTSLGEVHKMESDGKWVGEEATHWIKCLMDMKLSKEAIKRLHATPHNV